MKHLSVTIMGWPHPKGGEAWNNILVVLLYNYNFNLTRRFNMSKKQQQSPLSKIVNNTVDDNSNKEVSMTNTEELMQRMSEMQARIDELSKVKHSPTREDGNIYTIPKTLSESMINAKQIAPQAKAIMVGLVKLRAEKIEQGVATSASFTFTRKEWADASVRLGGLKTRQGADRVNKWYLNQNSKYQLLEDERNKENSLGFIQRATK
tara:strand:+ start:2606 stop:3226 length:621 start_codon:yes stop_codon:yes gene_type:complete